MSTTEAGQLRARKGEKGSSTRQSSLVLRLFVAGGSPRSRRAQTKLLAALKSLELSPKAYHLELIDVFLEPARAVKERIMATPALILIQSSGSALLIGDFDEDEDLLSFLRSAFDSSTDICSWPAASLNPGRRLG